MYHSDEVIVQMIGRLQRTYGRGVLPWEVVSWLPFGMSIGYARKVCARLWREGRLHRVGGSGARRGYKVMPAVPVLRVRGGWRERLVA
jgi:hypothetical protein